MVKEEQEQEQEQEQDKVIYETESFKIRNATEEQKKELEKELEKDKGIIPIKYKDLELNLCGFNIAKNKEGKIVFAYKLKIEDKGILIHIPKDISEKDKEMIWGIVKELKIVTKNLRLNIMDSYDFIKNIYNEKHILDKLGDKDKDKGDKDKDKLGDKDKDKGDKDKDEDKDKDKDKLGDKDKDKDKLGDKR